MCAEGKDTSEETARLKGIYTFCQPSGKTRASVLTRRPDLEPRLQLDVQWNLIGFKAAFNAVLNNDWTQATLARTKSKDKDLVASRG